MQPGVYNLFIKMVTSSNAFLLTIRYIFLGKKRRGSLRVPADVKTQTEVSVGYGNNVGSSTAFFHFKPQVLG